VSIHRERSIRRPARALVSVILACTLACAGAVVAAASAGTRATTASASETLRLIEREVPAPPGTTAVGDSAAAAEPVQERQDRVDVYYFHRTARCDKCLKFEAYTAETLLSDFPKELADGRVVWTVVNLDEQEDAHFQREYQLLESSLVLSVVRGGQEKYWKNLERIWDLVDDKQAFASYVAAEIDSALVFE
jgi:hypothetical protein